MEDLCANIKVSCKHVCLYACIYYLFFPSTGYSVTTEM